MNSIGRSLVIFTFLLMAITASLIGPSWADDGFEWRKIVTYKVVPLYVRPTTMSPIHEVMTIVQVKAPAAKVESFMKNPSSMTQFIGKCSKATLARTKEINNSPDDYYLYSQIKFASQSDFLAHWVWTKDETTGKITASAESIPSDLEYDGIRRLKYFASSIQIIPLKSSLTEIRISMIVDPGKEQPNMSTDDAMGILHDTGMALRHLFTGATEKEMAVSEVKNRNARPSELAFDQKKEEAVKTQPNPVKMTDKAPADVSDKPKIAEPKTETPGSTSTIETFGQAMRLVKSGNIEKATPLFEKAYASNKKLGPMIAAQYELQGEIALDYNGDMKKAASYYKTADKFRGNDGEVARSLLAKGNALGKSPKAERYIQCAMLVDPKYGEEKKEEAKPVGTGEMKGIPAAELVAKEPVKADSSTKEPVNMEKSSDGEKIEPSVKADGKTAQDRVLPDGDVEASGPRNDNSVPKKDTKVKAPAPMKHAGMVMSSVDEKAKENIQEK